MLISKTRWILKQEDETIRDLLIKELDLPPLLAVLLVNRGIKTVESARSFLYVESATFHDPYLLTDMEVAVNRIKEAIENDEQITIFGDYDADGVSSTTIVMKACQKLGAKRINYYIPNRFREGYGPNEAAFKRISEAGTRLLITVDTGISAVSEALIAKRLGMDYIITDHHELGSELPEALAILHPKKPGETYPFSDLAGAGVAFTLARALLGETPNDLLELAAIGTIADLVPLHGENRLIAMKGIASLKYSTQPGIQALSKIAGANQATFNEDSVGFGLAPRINAAGRLGDADPAVRLLLTEDREEAEQLAEEIDTLNKERQSIVQTMVKEALEEVETNYPPEKYPVLVIGREGWNPGVVGIVASKLVDKYYRPTICLSFDREKGLAKGSARSIRGFDLYKNLSINKELLPHFGGHPMAAGMTLSIDDVDLLRTRLCEQAKQQLSNDDFIPVTEVDGSITLEDVSIELIQQLNKMAPFGMNNPKPRVLIEDVKVATIKKIGSEKTHLKIQLENEGRYLDGVGFGLGQLVDHVSSTAQLSVIGELSINEWNNIRKPQLFVQDMEINRWQLFDYRSEKKIEKCLEHIPSPRKLILFHEESRSFIPDSVDRDEIILVTTEQEAKEAYQLASNILLIDIPDNKQLLNIVCDGKFPDRVYLFFKTKTDSFFSTFPTRDHFKWFYAYLIQKGPLNLAKHGEGLSKYKGWSKETVNFMTKVFFELDFVTIKDGLIYIEKNPPKREFHESESYRLKQTHMKLEKELVYAPFHELYTFFNQQIVPFKETKEENTQWI